MCGTNVNFSLIGILWLLRMFDHGSVVYIVDFYRTVLLQSAVYAIVILSVYPFVIFISLVKLVEHIMRF